MYDKPSLRLDRLYSSSYLPWIIIGIGILLRLARYLHNPSLNFDEAATAVDATVRDLSDLIHLSPDSTSTYPASFVIFSKLAVQVFGNTEYALRLYPLLLGISSVFMFSYVAKHYISPKAVPPALFLFAILDPLVYFSSMIKPYSGDVFFALFVYASLIYFQSRRSSTLTLFLFSAMGALAIWFSNPSVFVLAGVGASLILLCIIKKEWSELRGLIAVCSIWALSTIIYYFLYLKPFLTTIGVSAEEVLKREHALFPFPPTSLADIKWYIDTFFATFNFTEPHDFNQSLMLTGITALLFLAGGISMYSKAREKLIILIAPVLFTLMAAAMHQYPFKGRLILFLIPAFLLIIAEGIVFIYYNFRNSSKNIFSIIMVFLFIYPVSWTAYHVKEPLSTGGVKPALQYVKDHWQEGDVLYVHFYAQYEFDYYTKYYEEPFVFDNNDYIIGIAPRNWYNLWKRQDVSKYYNTIITFKQSSPDILQEYIKDIDKLTGRIRVWVLFVLNIPSTKGIKDKDFFLFHLDTKGTRLDSFNNKGLASVYLYNLRNPSSTENDS